MSTDSNTPWWQRRRVLKSATTSLACFRIKRSLRSHKFNQLAAPIADLDDWREELVASGVIDDSDANPWQSFKRIRQNLANRQIIGERGSLKECYTRIRVCTHNQKPRERLRAVDIV